MFCSLGPRAPAAAFQIPAGQQMSKGAYCHQCLSASRKRPADQVMQTGTKNVAVVLVLRTHTFAPELPSRLSWEECKPST
jgi:hypothetical protein